MPKDQKLDIPPNPRSQTQNSLSQVNTPTNSRGPIRDGLSQENTPLNPRSQTQNSLSQANTLSDRANQAWDGLFQEDTPLDTVGPIQDVLSQESARLNYARQTLDLLEGRLSDRPQNRPQNRRYDMVGQILSSFFQENTPPNPERQTQNSLSQVNTPTNSRGPIQNVSPQENTPPNPERQLWDIDPQLLEAFSSSGLRNLVRDHELSDAARQIKYRSSQVIHEIVRRNRTSNTLPDTRSQSQNIAPQVLSRGCDCESCIEKDMLKCFFQMSGKKIQEEIQNVSLSKFDKMFADFEFINAQNNLGKITNLSNAYVDKIKICIEKFRTASYELLVTSDKSRPEDVALRQMLKEYGLRKELTKIKTQSPLVKDLLSRYSENAEIHEKFLYYSELAETDYSATEERNRLWQDIKNLRGTLQISFVDFLILINHRIAPENIFKYIDFLEPEYFEWDKLIDFVNFSLKCIDKPKLLPLALNSEKIQEKVDNFINKITAKHILLIKYGAHKANKSDDTAKKFIEKAYTFKQLALFWGKPKSRNLNTTSLQSKHVAYVQNIFLEDLLHRMENVENIDSIMSLCTTDPSVVKNLLVNAKKNVLLKLHCYVFHAPKEERPHYYEENAKKKFNEMLVERLEVNLTPEYILKLMHDEDYYVFANYLSYKTISKIFRMLDNPPKYIRGDRGEVYNMQDILSENAGDKFFSAINEGFQNDTLCDKSPELIDLIRQESEKYNDTQINITNVETLHGAVGSSCGDEENIEKVDSNLSAGNDCGIVVRKCFDVGNIYRARR